MTTQDAKAYLAKREIPQLFESLMTGLMYYRPEDHINYLQDCLNKVKQQGVDTVRWNLFIEQRRRTPLPPISGGNGRTETPSFERDTSFITEGQQQDAPRSLDDKGRPLPPISPVGQQQGRQQDRQQDRQDRQADRQPQAQGTRVQDRAGRMSPPIRPRTMTPNRISQRRTAGMPNCPIVLIMGGPGSGRATQCGRLTSRYDGWVHLSVGDLLRDKVFQQGSADDKWEAVGTLIRQGEMAPEDVTVGLLKESLQSHMDAVGIILEGYPRTTNQVEELKSVVGDIDLAFVLDCEESYLQQRLLIRGQKTERLDDNMKAIANRITFFKEHTLPVIKYFDDSEKVVIIDGDRDAQEIFYDLSLLFDHTFYCAEGDQPTGQQAGMSPRPPSAQKPRSPRPGSTRYSRPGSRSSRPGSGFTEVPRSLELDTTDVGRVDDLPSCPILLVLGGPGVNRLTIANLLAAHHPGSPATVLSTGQLLINNLGSQITSGRLASDEDAIKYLKKAIHENKDATGLIIEGFPRTKVQLESIYSEIGGINGVVLLDCEREFMEKQLANKGLDKDEIYRRISHYKYHTLPIIAHFDDQRKLVVSNFEQDESAICTEVHAGLQVIFGGTPPATPQRQDTTTDDKPPRESPKPQEEARQQSPQDTSQDTPQDTSQDMPQDTSQPSSDFPNLERIELTVADSGRKPGGPQCCMIAVVGAPGSGVSEQCSRLVEKFPGFVHAKDLATAQDNSDAKGVIFENYPSKKSHIEEFNEKLGGLNCVVVLDCNENYARQNAGSQVAELDAYKSDTLPALAHYEEQSKLAYVNIEQGSDDVFTNLCNIVERTASGSEPECQPDVNRLEVKVEDTGRKSGLPTVPIISVIGNTGSHCSNIPEKMPGVVHLKCDSVDNLVETIKASTDAKGFIIENFPCNTDQFEQFNLTIGDMTGVVMMDASESFMKQLGVAEEKLQTMQQNVFPIIAHYEDLGKMEYIDTEVDQSTTFDSLCKALKMIVHNCAAS